MVCPNDASIRQRLETAYRRSPSPALSQQLWGFCQQIGMALVAQLTRDRTAPRISHYYDVTGRRLWHVYDPNTQQRFTTASELEVRQWLERRHLQ